MRKSILGGLSIDDFKKKLEMAARPPNESAAQLALIDAVGLMRQGGLSVREIAGRFGEIKELAHITEGMVKKGVRTYAQKRGYDPDAFVKRGAFRPLPSPELLKSDTSTENRGSTLYEDSGEKSGEVSQEPVESNPVPPSASLAPQPLAENRNSPRHEDKGEKSGEVSQEHVESTVGKDQTDLKS